MRQVTPPERIIVHAMEDIPVFANEDEEREWWATHDLAPELWEPPSKADLERFAQWRARRANRSQQRASAS